MTVLPSITPVLSLPQVAPCDLMRPDCDYDQLLNPICGIRLQPPVEAEPVETEAEKRARILMEKRQHKDWLHATANTRSVWPHLLLLDP